MTQPPPSPSNRLSTLSRSASASPSMSNNNSTNNRLPHNHRPPVSFVIFVRGVKTQSESTTPITERTEIGGGERAELTSDDEDDDFSMSQEETSWVDDDDDMSDSDRTMNSRTTTD